jgi:hypothetical protein
MMNDQPVPPQPRDIEALLSLIALVSDPKGAAERVKRLSDAASAAARARAELAEIEQAKAKLADELTAARKANEAAMAVDREAQQAGLAHAELTARERQIELREAEVGRLHAEASKLKADWEAKTRQLRAALSQSAA